MTLSEICQKYHMSDQRDFFWWFFEVWASSQCAKFEGHCIYLFLQGAPKMKVWQAIFWALGFKFSLILFYRLEKSLTWYIKFENRINQSISYGQGWYYFILVICKPWKSATKDTCHKPISIIWKSIQTPTNGFIYRRDPRSYFHKKELSLLT